MYMLIANAVAAAIHARNTMFIAPSNVIFMRNDFHSFSFIIRIYVKERFIVRQSVQVFIVYRVDSRGCRMHLLIWSLMLNCIITSKFLIAVKR